MMNLNFKQEYFTSLQNNIQYLLIDRNRRYDVIFYEKTTGKSMSYKHLPINNGKRSTP